MKQSVEVLEPSEPLFGLNGELAYNFGEFSETSTISPKTESQKHSTQGPSLSTVRQAGEEQPAPVRAIVDPVEGLTGTGIQEKAVREVKRVELTSISGGKWSMEFSSNVSRRDINRLRVMLVIEFNRAKRRERLKRLQSDRRKEGSDE